ncbi:MAG: septum formation initiator family protein [Candidatus Paceibacterota bacterium]|jgi:cell division protein FtsL|nr:septum formation initiator family protein [Candidatus Paceibacterota bacterium]MDD5555244.1 septum formation initiator family protein [Candidatus Paceibacterota bacterium]
MIAKKRKKEKSVWKDFTGKAKVFLSIAFVLFLAYTNIRIFVETQKGDRELKRIEAIIEALNKEKEKLNFELGNTASEAYLEKVAREELGLQKPGEQVIVVKKEGEGEGVEKETGRFQFLKDVFSWIKEKMPE